MNRLDDQQAIDALLERFDAFFDAVLVEVSLILPRSANDRRATMRLLAESGGTWWSVALTVVRPSEFKFVEGPSSNLVLSDGLGVHLVDGAVFVDLAPYTDQSVSAGELRRSHQYVIGETCSFEVTEVRG